MSTTPAPNVEQEFNPNIQEDIERNVDAGWVFAIFSMTTVVIQLVLTLSHAFFVRRDLSTTEESKRKLLFPLRRRTPPKLNEGYYKKITYYTMASIVIYNLYTIGQTLKYSSKSDLGCTIWTDTQATGNLGGKLFLYLVLLCRLFDIYEKSPFSFPIYCIKWFGILLITYNLFVWILYLIFVRAFLDDFGTGFDNYPNFCGPGSTDDPDQGIPIEYAVSGFALVLEDIASVSVFYWAYQIPLKKAKELIESHPKYENKLSKIMYAGAKTKVLLLASSLSTLLLIFLAVITGVTVIICIDPIINSIVLMFMTAYYPDNQYYHKWCALCIKCCDRNGYSKHDDSQELAAAVNKSDEMSVNVTSIDTASQLRDIMGKLKIGYQDKGYNNLSNKMLDNEDEEKKIETEDVELDLIVTIDDKTNAIAVASESP